MFGVYLPMWLYRALPYLYILSGATIASVHQSFLALTSAFLFVAAGVVAWFLRRAHRRKEAISAKCSQQPTSAEQYELEEALRRINERLR